MILGSIIDYPKEVLNEEIWNKNGKVYTLNEEVEEFILDIVYTFLDSVDLPESSLVEVFVYGSMLSNQYNEETDIDARILLDPEEVYKTYGEEISGDDLFDMAEDIIHDIKVLDTRHPLNMTVVIDGEDTELGQSELGQLEENPVYEVLNRSFLTEPSFIDEDFDPDVDLANEIERAKDKADEINEVFFELEKDLIDHDYLVSALKSVKNKKKFKDKLESKKDEILDTLEDLYEEQTELKKNRYGLGKEHKDIGNITYKIMEKYKLLNKLKLVKRLMDDGFQESDIDFLKRIMEK